MLKVGILGAGFMGQTHAQAYKNIDGVELVAVADTNKEKAAEFGKKYNARVYDDVEKIIERSDINIVDICLPTLLHEDCTVKAAKAGKHVFCEKPIALTLEQADNMIEAIDKAGVKFMVAHVVRFWPGYLEAKQIIDANEVGSPLHISAHRMCEAPTWSENGWLVDSKRSGGVPIDMQIHDIDYINWIFGKPSEVFAQAVEARKDGQDHVSVVLRYPDKRQALIETGWMMPKGFPFTSGIRILCEQGCIEYLFRTSGNVEGRDTAQTSFVVYKKDAGGVSKELLPRDPYAEELKYFIQCISEDREVENPRPVDARAALEVAIAISRSARLTKVIRL